MNIPEYITYKGKTHSVLGWAGKQYRLDNGTFAPMADCTPIGAKVESVELEIAARVPEIAVAIEKAMGEPKAKTEPKKAGRPRKNARA